MDLHRRARLGRRFSLAVVLALLVLTLAAAGGAAGRAPAMTVTLASAERAFSPDGDGQDDTISFSYRVSERSRVTIVILDSGGTVVRHVQTDVPTEDSASFSW